MPEQHARGFGPRTQGPEGARVPSSSDPSAHDVRGGAPPVDGPEEEAAGKVGEDEDLFGEPSDDEAGA